MTEARPWPEGAFVLGLQGYCGSVGGGYKGQPCAETMLKIAFSLLTTLALQCPGSCPTNLLGGSAVLVWWVDLHVAEAGRSELRTSRAAVRGGWKEAGRLFLEPSTVLCFVLTDAG